MIKETSKNKIDSILRVDHAGETAAAKIYDQAKDTIPKHYDTAAVYEQLKINNNS